MSNHPNRNWRRRWSVDPKALEARHECGLVVRFRRDDQGWLGDAVAGVDKVRPMEAATLMNQAGEIFTRAYGAWERGEPDKALVSRRF